MQNRFITLDPSAKHNLFDTQAKAIDRIYSYISDFPTATGSGDPDEHFAVNYVIALLGERGSGKTTALFRTRAKLREVAKEKRWLVTGLFVPDVVHSLESLGPAIIQVIQTAILSHEQAGVEPTAAKIKELFATIGADLSWFWNSIVPNEVLIRDSVSSKQFAEKAFGYHQNTSTLPSRFSRTIEQSLDLLDIERLIFLVDDADISIELVEKTLDFVRYFLSTPRVVTVMAADDKTLNRRLFNRRLSNLDSLDKLPEGKSFSFFGGSADDFKQKEIEAEQNYVDAFLTKVLPPSTRVYLPPVENEKLFNHSIKTDDTGSENTAESYLKEISFYSTLEDQRVYFSDFVRRYPGALESNLRSFINQFNMISEIVRAYVSRDNSYFGLSSDVKNIQLDSGALELQGEIDPLDEAALLALLRVFMSSPIHSAWREVWTYFGIIDVLSEHRLSNLLNTTIPRLNCVGTGLDSLIFNTPSGNGTLALRSKEETHIFHIFIDIALHFGVNFSNLTRQISFTADEGFRYFYLSDEMHKHFQSNKSTISDNFNTIDASPAKGVSALFISQWDSNATQPVHVTNAKELARHIHTAMHERTMRRAEEANSAFSEELSEEKTDKEKRLQTQRRQFYKILYFTMDTCVDQIRAVYSILTARESFVYSTAELSYTTNVQLDWGIVSPLQGWSFFERALRSGTQVSDANSDGKHEEWDLDYILLFLLHTSQLPYQVMFACFASNSFEQQAHKNVVNYCRNLRSKLIEEGLVIDGTFVDNSTFRSQIFASHGYERLKRSCRLWPDVNFGKKGERLLRFLDFIESEPGTLLQSEDIRTGPPSVWKVWADALVEDCRRLYEPKKDKKK